MLHLDTISHLSQLVQIQEGELLAKKTRRKDNSIGAINSQEINDCVGG